MNALEDILGLTAALVAARPNSSTIAINGSTFVTPTRVGSGEKFELVFIIACYCVHRHLGSHFDHSLPENKLLYHRFERAGWIRKTVSIGPWKQNSKSAIGVREKWMASTGLLRLKGYQELELAGSCDV
jgi:hypothetical protein